MDIEYKKEIVNRILSRAETSLYFLEDFLLHHSAKDGAYFRNFLIILSYSFELTLKARIVLISESADKDELEKELKDLNHDISKISEKLGEDELNNIGIKSIENRTTNDFIGYIIKTTNGKEISVEHFTDVRYDFMNDSLRSLPEDEAVRGYISEIFNIIKKIRKLNA